MEEVLYLVNSINENSIFGNFIRTEESLKEFSVYNNYQPDFSTTNIYIEVDPNAMLIESNDTPIDTLFSKSPRYSCRKDDKPYYKFIPSNNNVGFISPRIFRPFLKDYENEMASLRLGKKIFGSKHINKKKAFLPYDKNEFISSINQLHVLIENLKSIFLTIHPEGKNLEAYGHNIRNLLILACTEVEAQFKGILIQNGYNPKKDTHNTKDFFELNKPLKLEDYSLKLSNYPWLDPITPFKGWRKDKASSSIIWYDNYNGVKHNRVGEFHKGTLQDVISSISAIASLLVAQYGFEVIEKYTAIINFFEFTQIPNWSIKEYYIPPQKGKDWVEKKYF